MRQLFLILAGVIFLGVCISMKAVGDAPPQGWSTACRIVSVIDGDTIEVEIKRTVRVRLIDCWAPESRTKDINEKQRGLASKEHLRAMADGCDAVLFVPASQRGNLSDVTTLGRVLGQVWLDGDKESLAEKQVKAGHAAANK